MWSLFYNKTFWVILFVISISGGVVGYLLSKQKMDKFKDAKVFYLREFREDFKNPSIWAIQDKDQLEAYIEYMENGNSKKYVKPSGLFQGQKVYVAGFIQDSLIAEVLIKYKNANMLHAKNEYYYIWHDFLTSDSTITNKIPKNYSD